VSKRGLNNLDVAVNVLEVMEKMSSPEKFRFEQALVKLIPLAIQKAADEARAPQPTKKSQKVVNNG
jgi:hypothetical protein